MRTRRCGRADAQQSLCSKCRTGHPHPPLPTPPTRCSLCCAAARAPARRSLPGATAAGAAARSRTARGLGFRRLAARRQARRARAKRKTAAMPVHVRVRVRRLCLPSVGGSHRGSPHARRQSGGAEQHRCRTLGSKGASAVQQGAPIGGHSLRLHALGAAPRAPAAQVSLPPRLGGRRGRCCLQTNRCCCRRSNR